MNQCDRIRLILQENKLKQNQLAAALGVTESYISKLLKEPDIRLSQTLAALIEEKFGYNMHWVLDGTEPKWKPTTKSSSGTLSELHYRAIVKLEKLNEAQVKAVLAFINCLEELENTP